MNTQVHTPEQWPTLLLIPGMQCTTDIFTDLAAALRQRLPGLDLRSHLITADTLNAAADGLVGRLDRPTVLVGHSLGGTVALATARRHPGRVAGLVCLCANPRSPAPDQIDGWRRLRAQTRRAGLASADPTVDRWVGHRSDTIDRRCRRMIGQVGAAGLIAQLGVQLSRIDERRGLAGFDGPVLAVAADADKLVHPEVAAETADAAPRGRFALIPGDHLAPMTNPVPVAQLISGWLTDEFAVVPTR